MGEGKREEGKGVETNILFYKKFFKKRILSVRLHVSMWLIVQNLSSSLPCIRLCLFFFVVVVTGATQSPHIQLPYINCNHNESLWYYQEVGLFTHSNVRLGGRDIMSLDYCFPAFVTAQHTASLVLHSPNTMLSGTLLSIWWQSNKTHTEEGWKLAMHKVHIKSQKHE